MCGVQFSVDLQTRGRCTQDNLSYRVARVGMDLPELTVLSEIGMSRRCLYLHWLL